MSADGRRIRREVRSPSLTRGDFRSQSQQRRPNRSPLYNRRNIRHPVKRSITPPMNRTTRTSNQQRSGRLSRSPVVERNRKRTYDELTNRSSRQTFQARVIYVFMFYVVMYVYVRNFFILNSHNFHNLR